MEAQAETAPEVCGLSAEPQRARTLGFRPPTPHVGLALASTDATQLPSEQRWQTFGQSLPFCFPPAGAGNCITHGVDLDLTWNVRVANELCHTKRMVKGGELELRYVTAVVRRKSGVKAAVYNGLGNCILDDPL